MNRMLISAIACLVFGLSGCSSMTNRCLDVELGAGGAFQFDATMFAEVSLTGPAEYHSYLADGCVQRKTVAFP